MSNSKKDQPYTSKLQGVAALLGGGADAQKNENSNSTPNNLPFDKIKLPPSQPRRYFDSSKLEELSRSIKELGILEPLLVRPLSGGDYELVAGERRLRAAQMAGLTEVPVVIREMDDTVTATVRLVENLQREDLNPIEETEGILELLSIEIGISKNSVVSVLNSAANAKKRNLDLTENVFRQLETIESVLSGIGRFSAESFRVSRIPLLNLPADVLKVLRQGKIEYTKARAIAKVKDEQERKELIELAIAQNLSLSQISDQIKAIKEVTTLGHSLKERYKQALPRLQKSKVWDNPKKQKTLEKLLTQIEALLDEKQSI